MKNSTRALLEKKLGRALPDDSTIVKLSVANLGKIVEAAQAEVPAAKASGMSENLAAILAEVEKASPGSAETIRKMVGR